MEWDRKEEKDLEGRATVGRRRPGKQDAINLVSV